jgi:guanine nucleotide-binding protein subunit alpha-12
LLLLGAGESGKSTFLKQMRIIHGIKFEPELMREYHHVIYQNIVKGESPRDVDKSSDLISTQLPGMQVLVDAREKLEIPWEHPNTHLAANQAILFHSSNELDVDTFRQYAPIIHRLWQDRAIKKAYDRRREFQLVSLMVTTFRGFRE